MHIFYLLLSLFPILASFILYIPKNIKVMNKIIASLRVLTFVNIKIFTILLFLVTSIVIGTKYVITAERERNAMICNIKQNEKEILRNYKINSEILQLDNKILSKSLNKKITYDSIDSDILLMKSYTDEIIDNDSLSKKLKEIVIQKEIVFKKIASFEAQKVSLDKVKTRKSITVVSTNTKKGLFRTKVYHDTLVKKYNDVNANRYIAEYNKTITSNSKRLNDLIHHNNNLSLQMKLIIDNYSNNKIIDSFKENEKIFNKLKENIKTYTIITTILLSLIIFFVYLLLIDIRKIKKSNSRNNYAVSVLIDKTKELRNENDNK